MTEEQINEQKELKSKVLEEINKLLVMMKDVKSLDQDSRNYDGNDYLGLLKNILSGVADGDDASASSYMNDYYNSNC